MYANLRVEIEGREPVFAHRVTLGQTGDLRICLDAQDGAGDHPEPAGEIIVAREERVSVSITACF